MVGATSCLIELFIICSCLNGSQKKLISILLCWVLWKREICLEFRDINKTFKSHLKWADFVTAHSYRTRNSMETARACFIFSQKYLWIYFYGFVTGFVRYESQTKLSACNALSEQVHLKNISTVELLRFINRTFLIFYKIIY